MTLDAASRLRNVLWRLLRQDANTTHYGEQELLEELATNKALLLRLLDVGDKNPTERREIEGGRIVVDGKPLAINADFARQVAFLSDQLDVSERYIAGLLHSITEENPNMAPLDCVETAVAVFHRRRRDLIHCLVYIFDAAAASGLANAPPIYKRVDAFARQHIFSPTAGASSLALNVLRAIETTGQQLAKAQTAKQSAVSQTVIPGTQGGTASFGADVLETRCQGLKQERRSLAYVIYSIARLGYLAFPELKKMVDWLSENPNHPMTFYQLAATLAAFDVVSPDSQVGYARANLATDQATLDYMKKKLEPATGWKEPGLKALVLLKWTLFLTEARHRDNTLETRAGFRAEELETQIWNGVQGDAFPYMARLVVQLHRKSGSLPGSLFARFAPTENEAQRESPAVDFVPIVLEAFEVLVRALIRHASSELRKIKQRQEDLVLANARSDRGRMFRTATAFATGESEADNVAPPPRNDIAALFTLIGILYSALPPEHALQFWGASPTLIAADPRRSSLAYLTFAEMKTPKLPSFLHWSVWSTQARDVDMSTALHNMLAGLATGQQCSELAYNFVARGAGDIASGSVLGGGGNSGPAVSWHMLFGLLESWAASGQPPRAAQLPAQPAGGLMTSGNQWQPTQPPVQQHTQLVLGEQDILFAESFLRLLTTVVTHSVDVRKAISGHAQFKAIPTLVHLVPLGLPLRLKGALFETLAAFCAPGAGAPGIEICKAVWSLMERCEVINVRGTAASHLMKGVEMELEQIETPHGQYPATMPFLHLLATLIHTPKRVRLRDRVVDDEPIQTIPDSLGQPYRLPGIGPYVSFVLDQVFARIPTREYAQPSDRWQTNDLCLCFIERCLASYDLESLLSAAGSMQLSQDVVVPFLVHPGYDVMKRILSNTSLQSTLLSYIVDGVDGLDKGRATDEPYFHSTLVRVLRIVQRVLEIQDIFLDVLVPLLSEFDAAAIAGPIQPRSYFIPLDQSLSFGPQYAPALAAYIAFEAYSELALLSIKIISVLAKSIAFTDLTSLIERSADSERILHGYRGVLEAETVQDVAEAESQADAETGAGAPDADRTVDLAQATRLAALDLLAQLTTSNSTYPNVGHFLLFGRSKAQQIEDPHALGAQAACVHAIIDLLDSAVPHLKGKHADTATELSPLFLTIPALAERCLRVVHNLCNHPRTSEFVTRYLRTQEDFFARQLAATPFQVPLAFDDTYIEVVYEDGSRVNTTVPMLSAFLRYRSLVLDLVALDLHILTNKGHFKGVYELLQLLFESGSHFSATMNSQNDDILNPFQEVGQSHLRIIELAQSLNFDWSDSLTAPPTNLEYLGQLDLPACVRVDESGCEVVDRAAVISLISAARRALHAQGRLVNSAQVEQLKSEVAYILQSCAVENHRREVRHAVSVGFEAWRKLLDMTLMKCFNQLPPDQREGMLFDLLHVTPNIIRSSNIQESTAILLAEAAVSSITKLRENRRYQLLMQSAGGNTLSGSLPAERLYSLVRSLVECVLDNSRGELVRGNLYAALVNYLELIASADADADGFDQYQNLGLSLLSRSDSTSISKSSRESSTLRSSLQKGTFALLRDATQYLVTAVARDAIDGSEVWKTVAFVLLDALVQLGQGELQNTALAALVRQGILANLAHGLHQDDNRLQAVLKPDPDELHALYVYEAKMSMLVRVALTRDGAERLLEAGVLQALTQCDYLDARPEADQSFADRASFLPSAVHRYHQLFMPALQLVSAVLATLGSDHASAGKQALEFLLGHRDTAVILLKNEADLTSLSVIEEVHILVSLCASALPLVPKTEMMSSVSGFGAIHAAILTLSARALGTETGSLVAYPQNDGEYQDSQIYNNGSSLSKFELTARDKTDALRDSLVVYLGSASEFTEPELTLVLSPLLSTTPGNEDYSRSLSIVPTIGDVVEALDDLTGRLEAMFKQVMGLSAELASRDQIRVDTISELVAFSDTEILEDLDIRQKRSLIAAELARIRERTKSSAGRLMNTLEMLLLLLWRHLQHYAEVHQASDLRQMTLFSQSTRMLANHNVDTFRTDATRRLRPFLQKLGSFDVNVEDMGDVWRLNAAYVQIMLKRLEDVVLGESPGAPGSLGLF